MAGRSIELRPGPASFESIYHGQVLTLEQLSEVYEQLYNARNEWHDIGLKIGIDHDTLSAIEKEKNNQQKDCLKAMLAIKFKSGLGGCLTWAGLCSCLRSDTVRRNDVAEAIEEYLKGCFNTFKSIEGLQCESDEIETEFAKLLAKIYQSLVARAVSKDRLMACLIGFNSRQKVFRGPNQSMFHKQKRRFNDPSATIETVWNVLDEYVTFFDYEILEMIVNVLGNDEDKENFANYEKEFEDYAKQRLFVDQASSKSNSSFNNENTLMFVKLDSSYDYCEILNLKKLEKKLCNMFKLEVGVLRLRQVRDGCILLVFEIPDFISDVIFPLSTDQESALYELGVTRLDCGDYHFIAKNQGILQSLDKANISGTTQPPDTVDQQARATGSQEAVNQQSQPTEDTAPAAALPDNPDGPRIPTVAKMMGNIFERKVNSVTQNIIIIGLTGSGKSTLVNAFLGREYKEEGAAREGSAIGQRCTLQVEGKLSARQEQTGLCVWDTPGYIDGAGTRDKKRYLREIGSIWKRYSKHDLVIFCIRAESRYVSGRDNNNIKMMIKLQNECGKDFWRNTLIVITFANIIEALYPDWIGKSPEEKAEKFKTKIQEYTELIKTDMKKCLRIDPDVVNKMKVVPAGHYTNQDLLDRPYWYNALWLECLETIEGQDRLTREIPENGATNRLTPEFVPEEFLEVKRRHKRRGALLGLLGGPFAMFTVPLGWWGGGKHGETEYAETLRQRRAEATQKQHHNDTQSVLPFETKWSKI